MSIGSKKGQGAKLTDPSLFPADPMLISSLEEIRRQGSLRSLTTFSLIASRLNTLGDFRPGNGIVAQALLSVSRRSASLHRPQGALGSGPPKPLAWDRSLPPAVRETGRRSVGNRKECRLRHDYASFPGPRTPSSLRVLAPALHSRAFQI